jgi:hypothetical protein
MINLVKMVAAAAAPWVIYSIGLKVYIIYSGDNDYRWQIIKHYPFLLIGSFVAVFFAFLIFSKRGRR